MKKSLVASLLLFFVSLSFLGTEVLAMEPAELAGEAETTEEREEPNPKDPTRRVQTGGKNAHGSFLALSTFLRSILNSCPGNIHLLQVFRV